MPTYSISDPAVLTFVIIPVLLLAIFTWGVRRAWLVSGATPRAARRAATWSAAAGAAWMTVTWVLAASGVARAWERVPPPFAFVVIGVFALAAAISLSRLGARLARLPLWTLVAVQGFRLPLELAMHAMYERGIMPELMSYSGRNFDIVTGASAIAVAALVAIGASGRRLVIVWNLLGSALLLNVVVVAMLATPVFRYFGEDQLNIWVAYPPFIWLPGVMVLAALAGHVIVFRSVIQS